MNGCENHKCDAPHIGPQQGDKLPVSAPAIPYCVNKDGFGPTWGNSLFEDSAEFTYGMFLATMQRRKKLADLMHEALNTNIPKKVKNALQGWLDNMKDAEGSKKLTVRLEKEYMERYETLKLLADPMAICKKKKDK